MFNSKQCRLPFVFLDPLANAVSGDFWLKYSVKSRAGGSERLERQTPYPDKHHPLTKHWKAVSDISLVPSPS